MQYRINNKGEIHLIGPTPRKFGIEIDRDAVYIQNVSRKIGDRRFSTDENGKIVEKEAIAILKFLIGEKNMNSNGCNDYTYYFFRNKKFDKKESGFPATRIYIERTGKAPKWSIKGIYKKGDKLSFNKKSVLDNYLKETRTLETFQPREVVTWDNNEVVEVNLENLQPDFNL